MKIKENNPELDFARISVLYSNTNTGYFGIAAGVIFFAYIVDQLATMEIAFIWCSAVAIAYIPRAILSLQFSRKTKNREITPANIKPWENYFFLASIAPYICFSSAVFIPYGGNEFIALLFFAVIVMTLISGSVVTYSTSLPAIFLFINATMLPLIAKTFWIQEVLFNALGAMLFISYVILLRLVPRQNKLLIENIALRIENEHQSLTDPLTKLGNRRRLYVMIENLVPSSLRRKDPFSIVLLDIDHFKEYNDEFGHSAGDEILISVSNILKDCSRDQDLVVRYGGEEFLLVLPSTNLGDAQILVDRIRSVIKEKTDITFSAGIAMHSDQLSFDQLVEVADECMYAAKAEGRDRYVLAEPA
ncbi:MAG: GGDEF domain-containing protein [Pseudohongiellaceae bacterium]